MQPRRPRQDPEPAVLGTLADGPIYEDYQAEESVELVPAECKLSTNGSAFADGVECAAGTMRNQCQQPPSISQRLVDIRASVPFLLPMKPEYVVDGPPLEFWKWKEWGRFSDSLMNMCYSPWFWLCVAFFIGAQLGTLVVHGDSFFGVVTGGVVESVGEAQGRSMRWHMCTGSALWALGFVQIFLQRFRMGELAWVHRWCGRIMLSLWFLVVGPTAAYLSLFVSPGPNNSQFSMAMFSAVSLDTTLFATYYFWRGWLVASRRKRGLASMSLHGRAMRTGSLFTMFILHQRRIQLLVIALRKVILTALYKAPEPWIGWHITVKYLADTFFNHHVILSVTTSLPFGVLFLMTLDGPRSMLAAKMMALGDGEDEELFGSVHPSRAEMLCWRVRVPVYIMLRWHVTMAWTADPLLNATAT